MKDLKKLINDIGFNYKREEKAIKAVETIFSLVASRDYNGMRKLTETKLGSAFLDIAEEYGANATGNEADWHWYEIHDSIVRYSRTFISDDDLKKENEKNEKWTYCEECDDEFLNDEKCNCEEG